MNLAIVPVRRITDAQGQAAQILLQACAAELRAEQFECEELRATVRRLRNQRSDLMDQGAELYAENAVLTSVTQSLQSSQKSAQLLLASVRII